MDNKEDFNSWDTGPFCRHWRDPSDCEETCKTCGHKCAEHEFGEPTYCIVEGCNCQEFVENT